LLNTYIQYSNPLLHYSETNIST